MIKRNAKQKRVWGTWQCASEERLRNYKALDVYVIKSDHKIQKIGKDAHLRWNKKKSILLGIS